MTENEKLRELLRTLYDHLEYCGWGNSWERSTVKKDIEKILNIN